MKTDFYTNFANNFSFNKNIVNDRYVDKVKNRISNLELVARLGINISDCLNKEIHNLEAYILTDREASIVEQKISKPAGWLDEPHFICTRNELYEKRKENLSKLILDDFYGNIAIEFLNKIFSKSADYSIAFMFLEATYEEMNFYLRRLEEYCGCEIGFLDL